MNLGKRKIKIQKSELDTYKITLLHDIETIIKQDEFHKKNVQ